MGGVESCTVCGCAVADPDLHAAWHDDSLTGAIVAWLDGIDPETLSRLVRTEATLSVDPVTATLAMLKRLAVGDL